MKDAELRGIVLQKFYDARHKVDWLQFDALMSHITSSTNKTEVTNICEQLNQHGLIDWRPRTSKGTAGTVIGKITAAGVDVIEGTARAPITIVMRDNSI